MGKATSVPLDGTAMAAHVRPSPCGWSALGVWLSYSWQKQPLEGELPLSPPDTPPPFDFNVLASHRAGEGQRGHRPVVRGADGKAETHGTCPGHRASRWLNWDKEPVAWGPSLLWRLAPRPRPPAESVPLCE